MFDVCSLSFGVCRSDGVVCCVVCVGRCLLFDVWYVLLFFGLVCFGVNVCVFGYAHGARMFVR